MKTFTIVIPAYNQLPLFQKALCSVLRQEEADYDIIVSDDSSGNEIERYIQELNYTNIHYYRHQGKVPADNWNDGLKMATGQYLILMHHDEEMVQNDYLKRVRQQMERGTDIVVSQVTVDVNGRIKRQHYNRWLKAYICKHPTLLYLINVIGPCACLAFRREKLQTFNTDLRWLVDVEWYYRMLKGRETACLHSIDMKSWHGHENQISLHIDVKEAFLSDKAILCRLYRNRGVRLMLFLYQHVILNIKQLLDKQ